MPGHSTQTIHEVVPAADQEHPAETEALQSEPFLSDPSLQEFPTAMTTGVTEKGSPFYTFRTEGGAVEVLLPIPEPEKPDIDPKRWAMISDLKVEEDYRGRGIATDLMRTAARELAAQGVRRLESVVVSSIAMRNRSRVFGSEKSDFREWHYDLEENPIPISDAQAAASLERSEARRKMYERTGAKPQNSQDSMGWQVYTDLTDPEIVAYLNKPLDTVDKTPRIVPEDEQHYPEEWEALAAINETAAAEAVTPQTAKPTLRERFATLKRTLQEKGWNWRRKTVTAVGVGATALALVSSAASGGEALHTSEQPSITQEAVTPPKPAETLPEVHQPQTPTPEAVTLEAWNAQTGAGTLWNVAKEALSHGNGAPASGADILSYSDQIAKVNHIKDPRRVHPGDKIVLPSQNDSSSAHK